MSAMSPSPARGSIARRVSVTGGAGLAVVLLAICGVMSAVVLERANSGNITQYGLRAQALADMAGAFDTSSRQMAEKLYATFAGDLRSPFTLGADGSLAATGGDTLNGNFTAVDRFHAATGGVATVFAAKDDDFVRITTSLKRENGARAIGTPLGKTHPAHALLTAGSPYTGPATLFGTPYMTRYEPVRDAAGKVIGSLFVGFDQTAYRRTLQQMAGDVRLANSGGIVIIDPRAQAADAVFVAHPSAAGRKVLEVFPQAAALLDALRAAGPGDRLPSPGLLADKAGDAWAVVRKDAGTGWWVVAEVSQREVMAPHYATLVPFWLLLGGATLLLGFGLFWLMQRLVAVPLRQLGTAVDAVARGDLTHPATSTRRDEVGELIRNVEGMRVRLGQALTTVHQSVESINTASSEIAHGNLDLSQRTEATAANLQQVAASIDELSGTARQTADAANTANQLASTASNVAERGGSAVSRVVSTMDEISTSSRRIADIIGTIDGIAFQTNILALNAAVEAARAGEQGRGFAVVAGEVRGLAQRSAEAAREIKSLIGSSVNTVETGSRLVAEAGGTMHEIVSSVQQVSAIIGEISAASGEQNQGIGQINGAVSELDRLTQQNAALVEESAAAAAAMKEQASRLSEVVRQFQVRPLA